MKACILGSIFFSLTSLLPFPAAGQSTHPSPAQKNAFASLIVA